VQNVYAMELMFNFYIYIIYMPTTVNMKMKLYNTNNTNANKVNTTTVKKMNMSGTRLLTSSCINMSFRKSAGGCACGK